MRSSDHKAEAERLLHLARTDEGKREDDPGDPLVVLQLAQTHALLAAVPDVEHQVLGEDLAAAGAAPTDLELTELLADRGLWSAAQWGNLMLIARDTREAIVLTKQQLVDLHSILVKTTPGQHTAALESATNVVDEWLEGFER